MNLRDWTTLAEQVSAGTATHDVLRQRGEDVLIARVPLADGSSAVFKYWNRRGFRGAMRRLTRTSTAHREQRSLQRLHDHGQPVPAPLAYVRLDLERARHTECLVIKDLGDCRDATEFLKDLIQAGDTAAIATFERDILDATRALIDCHMLDTDHRLPNFVVTPDHRVVRLDFELSRRVLFLRLHTQLLGRMIGTLLGSYVFAVQPDIHRMNRFACNLRATLQPGKAALRMATEQVQTMLERQKKEGGPDTHFTPSWVDEHVPDGSKPSAPHVILGVPFHNLTFDTTIAQIDRLIDIGRPTLVATANLDFIRQAATDSEMQRILYEAGLVIADGQPIVRLSRFFGPVLRERVTGSDLTPMLGAYAARAGRRLFLLGGAPGVAEKAAEELQRRSPGLVIAGCYSPEKATLVTMRNDLILERLQAAKPDILLVAFGAPKQEKWIHMHLPCWHIPVAIGVGGSLDFIAGTQRRASTRLQAVGLEWVGRLLADPRRLTGRYLHDGFFLLSNIVKLAVIHVAPSKQVGTDLSVTPEINMLPGHQAVAICLPTLCCEDQSCAAREAILSKHATQHMVIHTTLSRSLNSLELGLLVGLAGVLRQQHRLLLFYCTHSRPMRQIRAQRLDACFQVVTTPAELLRQLKYHNESRLHGYTTRDDAGRLLITLPIELTVSTRTDFEQLVQAAWSESQPKEIIVDAAAMRFIDSTGLALLVAWKKAAQTTPIFYTGFQETVRQTIRQAQLELETSEPLHDSPACHPLVEDKTNRK